MHGCMHLLAVTLAAIQGAAAAETVTKTVTKHSVSTSTVFVEAATPSCTNLAERTGFNMGFGIDPLVVTGSKAFAGYSTPANDPKTAHSGRGYLLTTFNKSNSNLDIVTVAQHNVTVVPNTSYNLNIFSKHNGADKFCQLYVDVTDASGTGIGGIRCDIGTSWGSCGAFFQTGSSTTLQSIEWRAQCFPNGPGAPVKYNVFFDDAVLISQ